MALPLNLPLNSNSRHGVKYGCCFTFDFVRLRVTRSLIVLVANCSLTGLGGGFVRTGSFFLGRPGLRLVGSLVFLASSGLLISMMSSAMSKNLRPHGYKGDADVYYIKPGCVPPQGMIMISGEDDVHQMMQALEGIKK